jgi:threonine synthase
MDQTSKLKLDQRWLQRLQEDFQSERVTDDEMCQTTRDVFHSCRYIADPHTAVALCGAMKLGFLKWTSNCGAASDQDSNPVAVLATASPCKFQEAVTIALGQDGWDYFMEHDFPNKARAILSKTEVDPIVYEAANGSALQDVQRQWEVRARQLMKELGGKSR